MGNDTNYIEAIAVAPARMQRRREGSEGRATGYALSSGGMDRAPGGASRSGQPHECLHAVQTGADRRSAGDQALQRSEMGRAGRCENARRSSRRLRCWKICTRAGCCCCGRWVRRSGRGNFAIRSGRSRCHSTIRSRCTRGTENITWRTSRRCANAKDGASAAPVSERAKRISRSCTSTQRSQ